MQNTIAKLNIIIEILKEYIGKIHDFIISKPIILLIIPMIYIKPVSVFGKFHDFIIVGM